jgi:hypothetical protein
LRNKESIVWFVSILPQVSHLHPISRLPLQVPRDWQRWCWKILLAAPVHREQM